VRIAHGILVDPAALELVDERAAREPVVDDADVTTEHVDGEAHEPTRYS
jgi:hypothetical protein